MKTEVYNGCNVYEWLTATRFLFQNHENKKMFSIWEQTMLEAGRKAHQQALTVLKVGVTCTRYVSLKNARPWVIHAYRNIKGRGLHVDEDTENVVPISQDDGPLISSSGSGNQKTSKSSCFLYEEHHDDKIVLTSEKPSTSKETQDHGAAVSKKIKMASDKNEDNSVKSGKSSGKITGGDVTHSDKGKHLTAIKRKLPGMDGEEMTSEPIETESSDRNSSEIQQSKRVKLDFANKEVDLNLSEESKSAVETRSVEANLDEEDSTKDTTDVESVKICNTENEGQQELNTEETQNPVKDRTARLRKRKKNDNEAEQVNQNEPAGVSTYDKVRLVIQPWRKPEGGLNKDVLKMMLESVMLFLMMNPGCPATELYKRYSPYLQPMVLTNLVDILEDIGCLSKQYMKKQKASLFSKPMLPQIVMEEEEDCTMLILPTDDCVLKMGLFGQEAFPNAKWPETCYPAIVEKRTKAQK